MKNRLNFVAAASYEWAFSHPGFWLILPYGNWQETQRVQIALIKYKNLWFAYYKCRRQQSHMNTGCFRCTTLAVQFLLWNLIDGLFLRMERKRDMLFYFLPMLHPCHRKLNRRSAAISRNIKCKIYLNAVFRYIDKVFPAKCSKCPQRGLAPNKRPTTGHTKWLVLYILYKYFYTYIHLCIVTYQTRRRCWSTNTTIPTAAC